MYFLLLNTRVFLSRANPTDENRERIELRVGFRLGTTRVRCRSKYNIISVLISFKCQVRLSVFNIFVSYYYNMSIVRAFAHHTRDVRSSEYCINTQEVRAEKRKPGGFTLVQEHVFRYRPETVIPFRTCPVNDFLVSFSKRIYFFFQSSSLKDPYYNVCNILSNHSIKKRTAARTTKLYLQNGIEFLVIRQYIHD